MSKIVKPFGRVVSRVVIEVDHNQQVKIEALESLGGLSGLSKRTDELAVMSGTTIMGVPMNPVKFALLLTSVLTSVLSTFKLPGDFKNAETSKSTPGDGDGNNRP